MSSNQNTLNKALIVGANGGMGKAISLLLAEAGFSLALLGRNRDAIEQIAKQCERLGAKARGVVCDISKIDNIEAAVNESIEKLEGLNFLINAAGISADGNLHETDLAGAEAIINTNLRAHLHLARHALPEINKQSGTQFDEVVVEAFNEVLRNIDNSLQ